MTHRVSSGEVVLGVDGLGHHYAGAPVPALEDVSFEVRAGEVTGLLGPNGAGKSTLMSLVAGLLPVQRGRLLVQGRSHDPSSTPQPGMRGAVALAPQTDAFYPMLGVRENLACFAAAQGLSGRLARDRVDDALARVQLQAQAGQRAGRLSGGMRRRLNLAIALLGRPRLLLLDEPTAGVDPQSRAFLLGTLAQVAAEGAAVLMSSHLIGEVESLAARVVILDHGRVQACGPLASLVTTSTPTLALTLDGAHADTSLRDLLAGFGPVQGQGADWSVQVPDAMAAGRVLIALEQAGHRVWRAQLGTPSLEQAFLGLTGMRPRDD